ncbi:MAG: LPS export ABC transporter permease LptG [Nitrospirota bacterium]|nr:LPS export ABC transporter permease LptG [Nitrospirota bacterium]MDE3241545.1 LPS export ABC transporter permease LptG [Nitrospirota bacterium]
MTILFRYMVSEYTKVFAMCFAGLMTVYLVVDFFEKVRKFIRYDAELGAILWYFLCRAPAIAFQIAPLGVLMATLLALGVLSRSHEITAMRSCGISLSRIAAPFVAVSFLLSLALLTLSALIMPFATAKAEYIKTALIEKKSGLATFKADRPWIQAGNRTLLNVEMVEPDGNTLRGVRLYRLAPDFRLTEMIEAKSVRYGEQGWVLIGGVHRTLLPDGRLTAEPFATEPIEISQTPEDFSTWAKVESEEMTLPALSDYVDRLRRDGYSFARMLTDYHGRIAFPFVCLIMAIVGIALSLRQSGMRGSGMAVGIGQALVIGFLYWTTHSVSIALGRSGVMAPIIAGWMANLLFLSFGGYLLLKVRQ